MDSKKQITDKQREARLQNLANGRKKRQEALQARKDALAEEKANPKPKNNHGTQYEIYDSDSNCSDDGYSNDYSESEPSDEEAFVISKKSSKPQTKKQVAMANAKNKKRGKGKEYQEPKQSDILQAEINELKQHMLQLAKEQKKQTKTIKKSRSVRIPKSDHKQPKQIILVPPSSNNSSGGSSSNASMLNALRDSIFK